MSIEKIYTDFTAALNRHSDVLEKAIAAGITSAPAGTVNTSAKEEKKQTTSKTNKDDDAGAADPIWYHEPRVDGSHGVVQTQAEFAKLKKANAKLIKIPESKYKTLVAAAEEAAANAEAEVDASDLPDYVQALIDTIPAKPEPKLLQSIFGKYLPKSLEDGEDRAGRLEAMKSVLTKFGAARLTEVGDDERQQAAIEAVIAMEQHFANEDNDFVSPYADEEDSMV